jgi:hypothetical protein
VCIGAALLVMAGVGATILHWSETLSTNAKRPLDVPALPQRQNSRGPAQLPEVASLESRSINRPYDVHHNNGPSRTAAVTQWPLILNLAGHSRPATAIASMPPTDATTVLLVRGHRFTDGDLERLGQLAQQCVAATPAVAMWVSLDTTNVADEAKRLRLHVEANVTGVQWGVDMHVHEYNSMRLLERFPALAQARSRTKKQWRGRSVAFGFHTEAISMWYELPEVQLLRPLVVWAIEGDVGYSGADVTELFRQYNSSTADLITHRCRTIDASWWHTDVASDAYLGRIPRVNRTWSGEYVQRFSSLLLESVVEMNNEGMHAWSEQAACSMAAAAGLTWESLFPQHMGKPFTYRHVVRDAFKSREEWLELLKKPKKQNKLYHPVKY